MLITGFDQAAQVTTRGGRVVSYVAGGTEVLATGVPEEAYAGALLAPWPNRVANGTWIWAGQELQLAVNEPERRCALHGLVAAREFTVVDRQSDRVAVRFALGASAGYPFELCVEATYQLTEQGLECSLSATNETQVRVPVALGVHPYLDARGLVDDCVLTIPADQVVHGDAQWTEIGRPRVDSTSWDLRNGRRVGTEAIDACWTDLTPDRDGRVTSRLGFANGESVAVWGGDTTRYVVVYNSDTLAGELRRRSIAIEPNTAPANALRSGIDLDELGPGESLRLEWGLSPSWLA